MDISLSASDQLVKIFDSLSIRINPNIDKREFPQQIFPVFFNV